MKKNWPEGLDFWRDKRVLVTGGGGFLGAYVVQKLQARQVAAIFTPRREQYDLRNLAAIQQLFHDTADGQGKPPDVVIHLAAHVGGIGANRQHPAEFFYDNLMMSVQL